MPEQKMRHDEDTHDRICLSPLELRIQSYDHFLNSATTTETLIRSTTTATRWAGVVTHLCPWSLQLLALVGICNSTIYWGSLGMALARITRPRIFHEEQCACQYLGCHLCSWLSHETVILTLITRRRAASSARRRPSTGRTREMAQLWTTRFFKLQGGHRMFVSGLTCVMLLRLTAELMWFSTVQMGWRPIRPSYRACRGRDRRIQA